VWTVQANFDGKDYPVQGSALADTIAYSRDGDRITGVAKKNGTVSLRETIVVSLDASHSKHRSILEIARCFVGATDDPI
jgi:hypothetical protein